MTGLMFILIVPVLVGIGSVVLWLRNRQPSSVESGIDAFQREMQALRPGGSQLPTRPTAERRPPDEPGS